MKKNKVFSIIQADIEVIEQQLEHRNGSQDLWNSLSTKYVLILPKIISVIKVEGKAALLGEEYDYRPELKKLKAALLTWVLMNEDELEIEGNNISNDSKELLNLCTTSSAEEELKNLILESKIYISKKGSREKKIGLKKIWDAFERLKTLECANKKSSVDKIIKKISSNQEEIEELINKEFIELTEIGNSYNIRHSETTQKKLPNSSFIEYLYFRMLSLVSLVLELIKCE